LFNRAPLSTRWHKDRVVVLGDASHAVLPYAGQGANLAIEDGLVLSELMTDPSLTANDALEKFHMRRYHRVARMVELSRVLGNFELTTTWWGDIARKFFFKALHGGGFIARQLEEEIALHCPVKLKGV
jgi:2-polyprenyl-6-methoxyphenol hydroxylase-like FAD-dependent oxidoreductase